MTIRRFERLIRCTGYDIELFETVPIRKARRLQNRLMREFLTSLIRCRLRKPLPASQPAPVDRRRPARCPVLSS